MDDFSNKLRNIFQKNNFDLSNKQTLFFKQYYNLILDWNQKINITSITDEDEIIVKHFLDSILIANLIKENSKIIDIGSGAGFPGIPLKIMDDSLSFVLIDSVNKKINFLNNVIDVLNLKEVKALHTRAEDLAYINEYRENFDYCVSRAVASLNILVEYCLPFVKVGGYMIAYKSKDIDEELNNAKSAIQILGGAIESVILKEMNGIERKFIIIKKIKNTPFKFPRLNNKPRIKPL